MASRQADILTATTAATIVADDTTGAHIDISAGKTIATTTGTGAVISN